MKNHLLKKQLLWNVTTDAKTKEAKNLGKFYGTLNDLILMLSPFCETTLNFTLVEGETNIDLKEKKQTKNSLYVKVFDSSNKPIAIDQEYVSFLKENGLNISNAKEKGIKVDISEAEIKKLKTTLLLNSLDQDEIELLQEHFKE